jgi:ATP-dependent helicase/DNAse subunit B
LAPRLTEHDGLIREGHPVIERVLQERYSATRLTKLTRDPLGFLWQYVLRWEAPAEDEEPLTLEPLSLGRLVHRVLELAVGELETHGGFAGADVERITNATSTAVDRAAEEFAAVNPIPPRLIWQRILAEAQQLTVTALSWEEEALSGQHSYAEVLFGDPASAGVAGGPWDPGQVVEIPSTDLFIAGRIDRIDIAGDGSAARVTDYKTGRLPRNATGINGGAELQRCIYAYAVQALLGHEVEVSARLLYPRDEGLLIDLEEPRATLETVAQYLVTAREQLGRGLALVGPDSGEWHDHPLTFALPANAGEIYLMTKRSLAAERLAPLPELWEMP